MQLTTSFGVSVADGLFEIGIKCQTKVCAIIL